jgi:FMN-dependent NADH-azoreductase
MDLNEELKGELLVSSNLATYTEDMNKYLNQFKDNDIIICATSLINYHASPAMVALLNKIIINGVTFQYGENGPKAILTSEFADKQVYVVATSGSPHHYLPSGPATAFQSVTQSFEFIGLSSKLIYADGTNAPENFGKSPEELAEVFSDTLANI